MLPLIFLEFSLWWSLPFPNQYFELGGGGGGGAGGGGGDGSAGSSSGSSGADGGGASQGWRAPTDDGLDATGRRVVKWQLYLAILSFAAARPF